MIYLPKNLYESLPHVYAVTGLVVLVAFRNEWGVFSGSLFLVTALLIGQMRAAYRKALALKDRSLRLAEEAGNADSLVKLVWRSSMECGNPLIDAQHRDLFRLSNEILDAMVTGSPKPKVEHLLTSLREEVCDHFQAEEKLLAVARHPLIEDHARLHAGLLAQTDELIENYRREDLELADVFSFIAHELLAMHIVKEDKFFATHRRADQRLNY